MATKSRTATAKRSSVAKKNKQGKLKRLFQSVRSSRKAQVLTAFVLIFGGVGIYMLYGASAGSQYYSTSSTRTAAAWNRFAPALRQCESSNRVNAVSKSGTYRGLYQYDRGTWQGYSGYRVYHYATADQAPREVQDLSAFETFKARGSQPWSCASYAQSHLCNSNCGDSTGSNADAVARANNHPPSGTTPQTPTSAPSGTPVGNFEDANCGFIKGWTYDPDTSGTSIRVDVYIDGPYGSSSVTSSFSTTANVARPDVNSVRGVSGNHGFYANLPSGIRDGRNHAIYVYGINTAGGGGHFTAAKTVTACANPMGNIDSADCNGIRGWTVDMNSPNYPIDFHVYVDGVPGGSPYYAVNAGPANLSSQDVTNYFNGWGVSGGHRFSWRTPLRDGRQHTYRLYAINVGAGNTNPQIAGAQTFACN